jgi:hypothetical protein
VYRDQRDAVYSMMGRWPGRVLEALSVTPLRLLLSNDIFAVLWRGKAAPHSIGRLPGAWVERLAYSIAGREAVSRQLDE